MTICTKACTLVSTIAQHMQAEAQSLTIIMFLQSCPLALDVVLKDLALLLPHHPLQHQHLMLGDKHSVTQRSSISHTLHRVV